MKKADAAARYTRTTRKGREKGAGISPDEYLPAGLNVSGPNFGHQNQAITRKACQGEADKPISD
jgi:hypothetical protein